MKFKELELGDKFMYDGAKQPDLVYEKVKARAASCCTPAHNCISPVPGKRRKKVAEQVPPEAEIQKVKVVDKAEENITAGSPPLPPEPEAVEAPPEAPAEPVVELEQKRLAAVGPGVIFKYNGKNYKLSEKEKSSGGKVAVTDVDTFEETSIVGKAMVEILPPV